MIQVLAIKNYALIEDIRVDFQSGLTTITGETGAGKSIILGALSLVLGKRADISSVKNPEEKCIIEAHFSIENYHLQKVFEENDLDYDAHTILRREILRGGKSRAFVNDTPVNLNQLQAIAPFLVDIHSQHETLEILSEDYQLEVIDILADSEVVLTEYKKYLEEYQTAKGRLHALRADRETKLKELDYQTFLYNELQQADLKKINQKELEEEYETLSNSEMIQQSFAEVLQQLEEESIGTLTTSKEARLILGRIRGFSSSFESFWERLNGMIIELEDLTEEIKNTAEQVSADPERLEEVNERLQTLFKLQQKHGLSTVEELLVLEKELEEKVNVTLGMEDEILSLEKKEKELAQILIQLGTQLHEKRIKAIPELKKELETILAPLGMPDAVFRFELKKENQFRANGMDVLNLLFSANKGMAPGPLRRVASGGEMSRIMLSIKSVLAKFKKLPTLIFDEIDTGVSGEVANKMAEIMVDMSRTMQVLTITHLPQVAAKGKQHLKVFKQSQNDITATALKQLGKEERILEIAGMLSGKNISEAALANAKEMLN